ncbi:MAG: ABC transporter permease [Chloroflexi bacterium]|nr:ABC transporter permease [Chloroflexi bacterium CFX1]MCK6566611.1 ABC transporter permease [Anaerolineales bacterium]MCQ3952259.1 ABC transporter permease [Chloroflexota bacterium]MDL1918532.1 ABC transporter permease [Chloroflexi bacterium CFX5]NUQ58216.1 ABC transporter permease [Anaerolineales bacterium]
MSNTTALETKEKKRSALRSELLVPALAVLSGLILGAIVILVSGENPLLAYGALFKGSFGNPLDLIGGLQTYFSTGETRALLRAIYPFTESLVTATPYIFAGLSVALGFRCGLFNIGAEGQFFIGALCSAFVGYSIQGLPMIVHLPLAILAGALGGALWGMVPGYLKARFGAHEVVNTIMMNWIAFRLSDWLLNGPMKSSGFRPVTPNVLATAELPRIFPDPLRFNLGFFIALLAAYAVYWFLFKTTLGFEIRSVGANPDAARYAGMSVIRNFVLVMALAGGLAGMAGTAQVLGVDHWVGQGFSAGYGFDAIALALLGKSHPFGVVLSALLFGFLRSGATNMQSMARIPIDIISIIQGMVIIFIAAPDIIRWLYRMREVKKEETVLTRGWGS